MPIQKCWELAQRWYAGRLDRDWKRPDKAEIQQLFDKRGINKVANIKVRNSLSSCLFHFSNSYQISIKYSAAAQITAFVER